MSTFSSLVYRDSAHRRLNVSHDLLRLEHYVESIYFAGVAVECMFLSFIRSESKHFASRHYLIGLLSESRIADWVSCDGQQFHGLVTSVYRRWNNDLRYISVAELKQRYMAVGLDKYKNQEHVRGDLLEYNAKNVFNSASRIVKEGELAWLTKTTTGSPKT